MKLNKIFFLSVFIIIISTIIYSNVAIKEMDNLKVWNNAYEKLDQVESYTLQEDIELMYKLKDKDIKQINTTIMSLQQTPFIQKVVFYDVNDAHISGTPETIFYLEEEYNLYYLHKLNGETIKNQLDPYHFYNNEEVDPFSFIFNHVPINMVKNKDNKYEYTFSFYLNQYQEKYHSIFDELVTRLSTEFKTKKPINVIDQELKLTIKFTEQYQFTSISIDLTNLFTDIIDDSYKNLITDYRLNIQYTFSNYNQTEIDEKEYQEAIVDDAPNDIHSLFYYPTFYLGTEQGGQFEYGNDSDVYKLSISDDVRYEFRVNSETGVNFYIVDDSNRFVNYVRNEVNNGYIVDFVPGEYFVFIENQDSTVADYSIESIIKSVYSETALK